MPERGPKPDWARLRELFPAARTFAYLDHAANGPEPEPVVQALTAYLRSVSERGYLDEPRWFARADEVRWITAKFVGARPEEVTFVENVSEAAAVVAHGLDWRPGDRVLTTERQFPANVWPWRGLARLGVQLDLVPWRHTAGGTPELRAEDIVAAITPRTRLVALSLVEFTNGFRVPVEAVAEVCRARGVLLFVDAIQAVGAIQVDFARLGADFLAFGGHKWLCGPEGITPLVIRSDVLDRLHPVTVGWRSVPRPMDLLDWEQPLLPTAARLEGGTRNMIGLVGLGAALEFFQQVGVAAIAARVRALTDGVFELADRLGIRVVSSRRPECRSGIVSLDLGRDEAALVEFRRSCLAAGVTVAARAGLLRVSPQFYNNAEDLARLAEQLGR